MNQFYRTLKIISETVKLFFMTAALITLMILLLNKDVNETCKNMINFIRVQYTTTPPSKPRTNNRIVDFNEMIPTVREKVILSPMLKSFRIIEKF